MISIKLNGTELCDSTCILVNKDDGEVSIFSDDFDNEIKIRELNNINSDTKVTVEVFDNSSVVDYDKSYKDMYDELLEKYNNLKSNYVSLCKSIMFKEDKQNGHISK